MAENIILESTSHSSRDVLFSSPVRGVRSLSHSLEHSRITILETQVLLQSVSEKRVGCTEAYISIRLCTFEFEYFST